MTEPIDLPPEFERLADLLGEQPPEARDLFHGSRGKRGMPEGHISKRETALGHWLPFSLYAVNLILWLITGLLFAKWNLLWLALFPLPALAVYWFRRRGHQP